MGSLDGLLGLDNFCHISFLIYLFIFSFPFSTAPPYLHLRPTTLLYLLPLFSFLSSLHFNLLLISFFFSFFLLQFKSHTTSPSGLTILACQIRSKNRGKFNFHGPSSKLSFNNSQYIPSCCKIKINREARPRKVGMKLYLNLFL